MIKWKSSLFIMIGVVLSCTIAAILWKDINPKTLGIVIAVMWMIIIGVLKL